MYISQRDAINSIEIDRPVEKKVPCFPSQLLQGISKGDIVQYNYGHWVSSHQFDPVDYFGFIYVIINKINNRKYIGKRNFIVKGSSRNAWHKYKSSSKFLLNDIKLLGIENFNFCIEKLCTSKEELAWAEIDMQLRCDVLKSLLPSGEKAFYNKNIHDHGFDGTGTHRSEKVKHRQSVMATGNNIYLNLITGATIRCKSETVPEGFIQGMSASTRECMSIAKTGAKIYHINGVDGSFWLYPGDEIKSDYILGRCPVTKYNQRGSNGPRADKTIYSFIHTETGALMTGTQIEFRNQTAISGCQLSALLSGRIKTTFGWKLITL